MTYAYAEHTSRNAGFLATEEQDRLRNASVFVCGVGGMGGAAVECLARIGVGRLVIADMDCFEVSNLNRQAFAWTDTVGREKTAVVAEVLSRINPELRVETRGADWLADLPKILSDCRVIVNGMDDLRAGIALYRQARIQGATVVDAYTSPCPSVTVVRPEDPRPEERLDWPTVGVRLDAITPDMLRDAFSLEVSHVMQSSRSLDRMDPEIVADILAGRRARSSYAPIVTVAGNLMAFEAVNAVLEHPSTVGPEGYFFDPWAARVESGRQP
jgi:hypothetical protein